MHAHDAIPHLKTLDNSVAEGTVDPLDTEYTKDMICPECGEKATDAWWEVVGPREDGDAWCNTCGKKFRWSMHTTVRFTTRRLEP